MRFSLRSMIVYSGRADAWNHPSEFFFRFLQGYSIPCYMIDSKGHWTEFEEGKKNLYYHLIDFHFQPLRLIIFEEGVVQYKGKYGNLKSSLFHISNTQYQYHSNFMWVYIFQLSNGPIYLTKWWPNFSRRNKHTLFLKLGTLILWFGATSSFTSSRISRGSKIVIENWVDILFALGRKRFQRGN